MVIADSRWLFVAHAGSHPPRCSRARAFWHAAMPQAKSADPRRPKYLGHFRSSRLSVTLEDQLVMMQQGFAQLRSNSPAQHIAQQGMGAVWAVWTAWTVCALYGMYVGYTGAVWA